VIAILIAYSATYVEPIHPRTARHFLEEYYAQVVKPKTRDKAWDALTPGFQKSDIVRNRKEYDRFWRGVKEVRVGPVDNVTGETNRFLTKLTYVSHSGKEWGPQKTSFQLVCAAWVSKYPFVDCEPKDIKIDYATLPDSLARLF